MECNRLIERFLNSNIGTKELASIFILYANGIHTFDAVLKQAEIDNINFKILVESEGLDYELIKNGE